MKNPVVFDIEWNACINCAACIAVCPLPAGFISDFDTIAVNTPCDVACLACEKICPVSAISHIEIGSKLNENSDSGDN